MANYLVIQSLHDFNGDKFSVKSGEKRCVRYGYDKPDFIPRIVNQVRGGESIDWGGAVVRSSDYKVLFDGVGPLPSRLR